MNSNDIKFVCRHCNQSLEAPVSMAGSILNCPGCNKPIIVPTPQPAAEWTVNVTPSPSIVPQPEPVVSEQSTKRFSRASRPSLPPSQSDAIVITRKTLIAVGVVLVAVISTIAIALGLWLHKSGIQTNTAANQPSIQTVAQIQQTQETERRRLQEEQDAKRTVAEAKQREEEEQAQERLRKMRGSIEGGAWVIKGGGQSELIRGLTIYVLSPQVDTKAITAALVNLREQCTHKPGYDPDESEIGTRASMEVLMKERQHVDELIKEPSSVSTLNLYTTVRRVNRILAGTLSKRFNVEYDKTWPPIATEAMICKGVTGIDAKYTIPDLKPGDYILYAQFSDAFSLIEWCIPVAVKGEQIVKMDFFNDNAADIINEK